MQNRLNEDMLNEIYEIFMDRFYEYFPDNVPVGIDIIDNIIQDNVNMITNDIIDIIIQDNVNMITDDIWKVRKHGGNKYLVKNMKYRGFPKYPGAQKMKEHIVKKSQELGFDAEKMIAKFDEVEDDILTVVYHILDQRIQDFFDNIYVAFCRKQELEPEVVGIDAGWWGILLDNYVRRNAFSVNKDKLMRSITDLLNSEWAKTIDDEISAIDIVDLFIDKKLMYIIPDIICINPDFARKIKKLDDLLESAAYEQEDNDAVFYDVLDTYIAELI